MGLNYAINLSLWDWLFRTAYMPVATDGRAIDPVRLGFEDVESFPEDLIRQEIWPLPLSLRARARAAEADAAKHAS